MAKVKADPKSKKTITVLEEELSLDEELNHVSFDQAVEVMKGIRQKYLEHSFLYQRDVKIVCKWGSFYVLVTRQETDAEYQARLAKAAKAAKTRRIKSAAADQKKAEQIKAKELEELARLQSKYAHLF